MFITGTLPVSSNVRDELHSRVLKNASIKMVRGLGIAASIVAITSLPASAFVYDFSTTTNVSDWQFSVDNGATFLPSVVNPSSSHELWPDPFGDPDLGDPSVWLGLYEFFLPEDAEDISLSLLDVGANDRVVFSLNGTIIPGSEYVIYGTTGMGIHDFGDGNGAIPFNFPTTSLHDADPDPIIVTDGFVLGGVNRLIAHVNNTGVANPAAPATDMGWETAVYVEGGVDYSRPAKESVPEPSVALALATFGLAISRKQRK